MPDDLTTTIRNAASDAASVSADGVTTTERPLVDLIAADQHLQSSAAVTKPKRGLRFTKLSPPGTT